MENLKNDISTSKFELDFSGFKGTTKSEYELLDQCFLSIKETEVGYVIKFKVIQVSKKIQPLDIIANLKNDKTTGQLELNVKDEDGVYAGKFKFKNLKFKEIKDLINFDYEKTVEKDDAYMNVIVEHDGITYETKSGKESEI